MKRKNLSISRILKKQKTEEQPEFGKSKPQNVNTVQWNPNLPSRLFPVNEYPESARMNIYSKPEYLGTLTELLRGSEAMQKILDSQFRSLFEFPVARCAHSGKLIHGMLVRQLVTRKKHELWVVFGGYPIRFSLREFHIITGLRCGPFPSESEVEDHQDPSYLSVWNRLFGEQKVITVPEVLNKLRHDTVADSRKRLSPWEKLSLALIVIVDGVIACNNKDGRVTERFVEMLHDTDFFMSYPWGRQSFNETMYRLGSDSPVSELQQRLRQVTSCCYGFPLAFQLQIIRSIPAILQRIKDPSDLRDFTQRSSDSLSASIILRKSDVVNAEEDPSLSVLYTLCPAEETVGEDFAWADEEDDPSVDMILSLINQAHLFKVTDWPSLPVDVAIKNPEVVGDVGAANSDDEVIILQPPKPMKGRGSKKIPFLRRPFTRSAKKSEPGVHPSDGTNLPQSKEAPIHEVKTKNKPRHRKTTSRPSDSSFVTHSDLAATKIWISNQLETLRTNIHEDMVKVFSGKAASQVEEVKGNRPVVSDKLPAEPKDVQAHSLSSATSDALSKDFNAEANPNFDDAGAFGGVLDSLKDRWDVYGDAESICRNVFDIPSQGVVNDIPEASNSKRNDADVPFLPDQTEQQEKSREEGLVNDIPQPSNSKKNDASVPFLPEQQENPREEVGDAQIDEQPTVDVEISKTPPGEQEDDAFHSPPPNVCHSNDKSHSDNECHIQPIKEVVVVSSAYFLIESTNPRQPMMSKRIPKRSHYLQDEQYTVDPRIRAMFASRNKKPVYSPIPHLDENEFDSFKSYLEEDREQSFTICTGHKLCNGHFLDIAAKGIWLTTEHMQVIMSMLLRRRAKQFAEKRVAMIDPWFCSLLMTHHGDFMKCEDKANFSWVSSIKSYITGKSTGKVMKSDLLKYVDVVYVPMDWGCSHWVGLVIDLKEKTVVILDPFIDPIPDEGVQSLIAPVTECLPWLLKRFVTPQLSSTVSTDPFSWERLCGIISFSADADCGPIVAKFLEMHAHGLMYDDMAGLDGEVVGQLRKLYAMETYAEFVDVKSNAGGLQF